MPRTANLDPEYAEVRRYRCGGTSRAGDYAATGRRDLAAERKSANTTAAGLAEIQERVHDTPWTGFQVREAGGAWAPLSRSQMCAILSAGDYDLNANIALMQAGQVMRLGGRRYRWTDGTQAA